MASAAPAGTAAEGPAASRESRLAGAGFWLYALHLWTVFGLALSNVLLGVALLVAPWSLGRHRERWAAARPLLLPLGLYALFLLLSTAGSERPGESVSGLGELLTLAAVVVGIGVLRSEGRIRLAVDGLILMAAVFAAVGLVQLLLGYGGLHQRIRGPFSHYMTFAGVLLLADMLLLGRLLFRRHGGRVWWWLVLAVINVALLGTLTRSAWIGLAGGLPLLLLLKGARYLVAAVPVMLVLLLVSPLGVVQRLVSIGDLADLSSYDRLCMAEAGVHMIREKPLLGLGPGTVATAYPLYRHPTAPRMHVPHLHNAYLQVAAEQGLLSLAALLWLLGASLAASVRGWRREGRGGGRRADLYLGALAALVAFSVAAAFEHNWGDTEVQRVLLFVAVIPFVTPLAAGEPEPEGTGLG